MVTPSFSYNIQMNESARWLWVSSLAASCFCECCCCVFTRNNKHNSTRTVLIQLPGPWLAPCPKRISLTCYYMTGLVSEFTHTVHLSIFSSSYSSSSSCRKGSHLPLLCRTKALSSETRRPSHIDPSLTSLQRGRDLEAFTRTPCHTERPPPGQNRNTFRPRTAPNLPDWLPPSTRQSDRVQV